MKRVIVTGANGFIGRYLCNELVKNDYHVYAVVRSEEEDISSIVDLDITIVYCDLNQISELENIISDRGFDCFYHMAWAGSSGDARKNYELQLDNARGCANAAKVASILKCRKFLGAGSVTELMYGEYLKTDYSQPEMVTCYAVGKIAAEYMSKCICNENDVDYLWTYISNFYGVGDTTGNFINFLIKNYKNNNTPTLTNGEQRADFMYVSDVARALVAVGEKGKANCSYYVGYGNPKPLKEFVLCIRDLVNPSISSGLGKKSFQGIDIDFDSLNINKLYEHTNFKPLITFEEGIKKLLEN